MGGIVMWKFIKKTFQLAFLIFALVVVYLILTKYVFSFANFPSVF